MLKGENNKGDYYICLTIDRMSDTKYQGSSGLFLFYIISWSVIAVLKRAADQVLSWLPEWWGGHHQAPCLHGLYCVTCANTTGWIWLLCQKPLHRFAWWITAGVSVFITLYVRAVVLKVFLTMDHFTTVKTTAAHQGLKSFCTVNFKVKLPRLFHYSSELNVTVA